MKSYIYKSLTTLCSVLIVSSFIGTVANSRW